MRLRGSTTYIGVIIRSVDIRNISKFVIRSQPYCFEVVLLLFAVVDVGVIWTVIVFIVINIYSTSTHSVDYCAGPKLQLTNFEFPFIVEVNLLKTNEDMKALFLIYVVRMVVLFLFFSFVYLVVLFSRCCCFMVHCC